MKLFKKTESKVFIPPSEAPIWAAGSMGYASLKR